MADQLFVQLKGETVRTLTLDMSLLSIGRTPDNGLALSHPTVAIRHAEVRRLEGQVVITDLGNGETFLAGRALAPHQPQVLDEGVIVQIGPYVLAYLPGEEAPAPPEQPDALPLPAEFQQLPLAPARRALPMTPAQGDASAYLNYLPALFAESDFLGRYLMIVESIWEPIQQRQDHLDMYFSPATAPESLLAWFSHWLGLDVDPHWPEGRKRAWLKDAMHLLRWRGTRYGLTRALEIGCGVTPQVIEDPGRPFTVTVVLPDPGEDEGALTRQGLAALVARHVPAHVEFELKFV